MEPCVWGLQEVSGMFRIRASGRIGALRRLRKAHPEGRICDKQRIVGGLALGLAVDGWWLKGQQNHRPRLPWFVCVFCCCFLGIFC